MNKTETLKLIEQTGAIITNTHVVYTSGRHGSVYVNKDAVYPHTEIISVLCGEIARHFRKLKVDVVVGPALGGIILSQWTAHYLTALNNKEVLAVYAEKEMSAAGLNSFSSTGNFIFTRGYRKHIVGKNVLIVEDVLTEGKSVKKVVELICSVGAKVVGVGALWNRGGLTAKQLGVPALYSLIDLKLEDWAEPCPLCKEGIPINTEVGKGKDFLAKKTLQG